MTTIRAIYPEAARGCDLEPNEIIADFTGGTAVMSAGMTLATIEGECEVEYLRQDKALVDGNGRARTPDEIKREAILITIQTTPALVSRSRLGEPNGPPDPT